MPTMSTFLIADIDIVSAVTNSGLPSEVGVVRPTFIPWPKSKPGGMSPLVGTISMAATAAFRNSIRSILT